MEIQSMSQQTGNRHMTDLKGKTEYNHTDNVPDQISLKLTDKDRLQRRRGHKNISHIIFLPLEKQNNFSALLI